MAKAKGGGKMHPLPLETFAECPWPQGDGLLLRCCAHRTIDPSAEHLRDRSFASIRFRCAKIRYTGAICGCLGAVAIEPLVLLPVGGEDALAFLSCSTCLPYWEINHVPIDRPPWSVVKREGNDRFKCPGYGRAVACWIHGPTWRPSGSSVVVRNRGPRPAPDSTG